MLRPDYGVILIAGAVLSLPACSANGVTSAGDVTTARSDTTGLAMSDLGSRTYLGFKGGLYENGSNSIPADHAALGAARARNIVPRSANGAPAANGKIVLLSIGMSNTSQEFCGVDVTVNCVAGSFMQRVAADGTVNASLVTVNGAQGGMDAGTWTSASARPFDIVRDERLAARGVTEQQVQVVWLLEATKRPVSSLPASDADAYNLESNLGSIVRALYVRYPNLQQVYMSDRMYGGYATTQENPEPFAFETGFAVKWLINAQIAQMRNSGQIADSRAGTLNYNAAAPWIAWGPDLWANGLSPRSDGLIWQVSDFKSDGTHPSVESGVGKVGALLMNFFGTSPTARCWFRTGNVCS